MNGVELIAMERRRQVEEEGWLPEHDDGHIWGEMVDAAACYLEAYFEDRELSTTWPWEEATWKPSADPIRNLVKAGALIAAEIDRIQRR